MFEAAEPGDAETVKHLLDCGVDIDARLEDDSTALLVGVGKGHVDITRILLSHGGRLDLTKCDGQDRP